MNAGFTTIDYLIFGAYAALIMGIGLWISRTKKGEEKDSKDYFLAGGTLSWWAIGASLIAANISAEHFIAMSGSGYAIGLGMAAYEWIAAIVLILVAKYLLPQMLDKKIFTMPQFARERYGSGVSFFFSFFWLLVYVFVNLTSVAWLGALAMNQILGVPILYGVPGLLIFAGVYSIYGGMKSVAWTDIVQVFFLIFGGLITAWFALDAVAGDGKSAFEGFRVVLNQIRASETDTHFNMIIGDSEGTRDSFLNLPGLAVIFGAMWLTNIGYWGFNQFIIQKGLAAKNLKEAKRGLLFAAYLKILIPIIVIIPGITAYVIHGMSVETADGSLAFINQMGDSTLLAGEVAISDDAYPWLLRNFAPVGIRGLAFAALVAAVISSLASLLNSTSTIFTLDIYKTLINKSASERQLVRVGRFAAFVALAIAIVAARPLLGGLDQAFQYIQEYTGFIYPGVVAVFGMGILWKRATNRAALWTTIATIPTGILMKLALPDLPWMIRMGYVFIILVGLSITLVLTDKHKVKATPMSPENIKKQMNAGHVFAALAIITFVAGMLWGTNLFGMGMLHLGFNSIFMTTAMMTFLAVIMYTNAKSSLQDDKAYDFNPDIIKTDKVFFTMAMGIVVIIVALYAYFW
ncbi:sodium:solute symporter family transporter [Alkalitalea saponilacus]|uniref:Solute:Na+ symporter, SSS family n=1 Tax=Alkalitalea saponilacus TaxID=889453 RepID=A0A1T5A8B0_9BACT|nr:sodium/solute symporter [Alkalitalea saponilacus]ASB48799.1 sodium/glucose cotransporter [Alkalitalea saponilacus]SKB31241.1 solute:Na+ symporter, SSS family [Alkalitalea saponilacus]